VVHVDAGEHVGLRRLAADSLPELLPADAALVVGREVFQPALELRHRDLHPVLLHRREHRPLDGAAAFGVTAAMAMAAVCFGLEL